MISFAEDVQHSMSELQQALNKIKWIAKLNGVQYYDAFHSISDFNLS